MKPDDQVRLQHMLDAARDAVEFMRGRSRADLDNDRQLTLAVVKTIEIIGEAAYRVSEPTGSDSELARRGCQGRQQGVLRVLQPEQLGMHRLRKYLFAHAIFNP